MLTHDEISNSIGRIASGYDIIRVSYFGSYADKTATDNSDLDLLVEFRRTSFFGILHFANEVEQALGVAVDIATLPLPNGSTLTIGKEVPIYEQKRSDYTDKDKKRSLFR
jgi:predicted nucleotidyltransferase